MTASTDVEHDLRSAEALIDVNRPNDALPLLAAVIAAAPDNVRAFCLLARCHSMSGDFTAMLWAADQATTFGPGQEWGHRLRSMALRNLGRNGEAVEAGQIAVELAPLIWQPYVNLTEALLRFEDLERRRAAYLAAKRAVEISPASPNTHVTLGRVLMSIGERDAAHACFERALSLSPTDATAHTNLAILDLNRGRLSRAGRGLRTVAASNPGVSTYASNVSVAARHWYVRALDIGTFICFAQILITFFVPGRTGGWTALGITGVYLAVTLAMYVRLPKPLRVLLVRHVRTRNRAASTFFLLYLCLITWSSLAQATSATDIQPASAENLLVLGILMTVRFRGRVQHWAQPLRLRRRYRRYVLGGDPTPLIPQQRPEA